MSQPVADAADDLHPRIASVGTAHPEEWYRQEEIAQFLQVPEGVGRRFFSTGGIDGRYLFLAKQGDRPVPDEDQAQLLARHRRGALELAGQAVPRCLAGTELRISDIDYLCCVTSTGFMMPGLSAMYIRHLGFRADCQRVDVVGMGCNAALNGLNAMVSWARSNRGGRAMMICCEINSAIYVRDDRIVTALVNSLFGDGCAAVLVTCDEARVDGPEVLGFQSHIASDAWRAISYHWSTEHKKFELYLDKEIPACLGLHSPTPITALLGRFGLCRDDVAQWLVHAGGKRVIGAVAAANALSMDDMRHALAVLKRFGNLGSTTVLFSYEDLLREQVLGPGDYGVMVTMGPGATIETALLRW